MPIHTLTQSTVNPFDPTALNAAIQTLRDNEAADDAAVEALDKIVKAITVPDIKPLIDRITALEGKTIPAQVIKVSSPPPDGPWVLALDVRKDWSNKKQTTRLWGQIEQGVAKPLIVLEDALSLPTHATATPGTGGSFKQTFPDGLELTYDTIINNVNEVGLIATFAPNLIKRIDFEGLDKSGVALELGGKDVKATDTTFQLTSFIGNGLVTQVRYIIRYISGESLEYLIPVSK